MVKVRELVAVDIRKADPETNKSRQKKTSRLMSAKLFCILTFKLIYRIFAFVDPNPQAASVTSLLLTDFLLQVVCMLHLYLVNFLGC